VPSANIRSLTLDLSSLAAVRKAAAEVIAYPEPLHVSPIFSSQCYNLSQNFPQVLINNAAATIGRFILTVDGLESQIATNHFGPFLFTKLLTPKLLASGTASYTPRVVFVSSMAHAVDTAVDFSAIGRPDQENYQTMPAYSRTKSANIITAIELSKRSKGSINAYSLHPGGASFYPFCQK
jgi:NAD(P)-dependent dehydrogenase (short-subunit alcohol dehydrogenase family)